MGFAFSRQSFSEDDLLDLHGKVAIVTGGNTGVGYGTVQWLVRKGAKVYVAGRSEERVSEAIKQLEAEDNKDGTLHFLKTELSDPRLAKQAAEEFLQKESRLDILVNNAAIGARGPYKVTKDGLLDIMATNHVGHFVLTENLLPLLKTTAAEDGSDVRIVNISSVAHERVVPESLVGKETLNKDFGNTFFGYLDTYGLSKLANILHIKSLQKQLDAENVPITCIAVHPGAVASVGANAFLYGVPYAGKFVATFLGPLFFIPWLQGARTSAFAAAGKAVKDDVKKYKGAYLVPVAKLAEPSASAKNERLAKELDETTRAILKEIGV
ncbi:NAD-P-binding protein [Pholiota conissans]|uniref:NAD-P-binding protein n=1 Tax=Pholiota conissans TaxID=109636 RepID=A0A9P5YWU5_9AGAR|nr:NAD-P-binding protein [Pholiota conissans]